MRFEDELPVGGKLLYLSIDMGKKNHTSTQRLGKVHAILFFGFGFLCSYLLLR